MKKQILTGLTAGFLALSSLFPISAQAAIFSDVPQSHWAYESVEKAVQYGIMNGLEDGTFGLGQTLTRAQFVKILSNLFHWNETQASSPFSDIQDPTAWYYGAVAAASVNGASDVTSGAFRPNDPITRQEMAVMMVKALGYDILAGQVADTGLPFTDVTENIGYITVAYDFGILSGRSDTTFDPNGYATREEAASMMTRFYEKYDDSLDFTHAFYAFSSFSQKELAANYDAVSFGWGRMELQNGVPVVNTISTGGNEWRVPAGYEDIVSYYESHGVQMNLNVFLSADEEGSPANTILTSPSLRSQAVSAILDELTVQYQQTGNNFFDGVTIDFEGLRGSLMRSGFTSFLTELSQGLTAMGKDLTVAVHPKLKNSSAYYDGYDLASIGALADHVIVMAYDYAPTTMDTASMQAGFTTTPVTPFDEVYYAIKTTVSQVPKEKLLLGLSIDSCGWHVENGVVTNAVPITLSASQLQDKLSQSGTTANYSRTYQNPYITYPDGNGTTTVWYENAMSMEEKIQLAKLFGLEGISIWRLGIVPDYSSAGLNVAQILREQ
ncbi:MAG TPA: S-layer homology domain-containing protein [Firmicutes bacterium]|nr:S-layer homology domain-containing protein [Bacillota bacterium]